MADNPPITPEGIPMRVADESFVLERKNVEIEVKIENCKPWGKRTATGKLYLTSCRMVFVNDKHKNSDFKSFDIPLFNLFKETFEQPIFGSNYIQANVKPLYRLIPDVATFKLWFKSGGCQKFLKLFDVVLREIRVCRTRNQIRGLNQRIQNGQFSNNAAYSDPTDPTVVFLSQPPQMSNSDQGTGYYQNAFQGQGRQIGSDHPEFNPIPNQIPPSNQQQFQPNQNQLQQVPNPMQQQQGGFNYPQLDDAEYQRQMQLQQQQQAINQQGNNPQQQQGQFQQQPMQMGQQQQPEQFPQQGQNMQPQQQGQLPQQQGQVNQQQQVPQQQNNPDVGFYFGFFGPQLQRNQE